jgi:hypothetical protein
MQRLRYSLFILVVLAVALSAMAQPTVSPCLIQIGDFRTQTQGGWGGSCNGQNAACKLEANFASVFATGLVVGGTFTMTFQTATAVENYLTAGGPPSVLTASLINPTTSPAGVFGGQVTTLAINVAFSNAAVPNFPTGLGSLVLLNGGPMNGWTVNQILTLANTVLGGNTGALPSGLTVSGLNDVVDHINNCYDDGTHNTHYLVRPGCDDDLPVEVSTFDAVGQAGAIALTWQTASESGVQRFEITRSDDSHLWIPVASVNSLGDNASGHNYHYTDHSVQSGVTYSYHLSVMGSDGSVTPYGQTVSAVAGSSAAAMSYSLAQNYPNPFNATTRILYTLKAASPVRLTVFDLTGRVVTTLVQGQEEAGSHVVNLDGTAMASGEYFYRLEAGSFVAMHKMILLK